MRRTVEMTYIEYWVIRVIREDMGSRTKTVVKEVEFQTPPTEQDMVDVLIKCEKNEFISVAHNYKRG